MFKRNLNLTEMSVEDQKLFTRLFPNILETSGCVIIFGHYRSGTTALTSLIELMKPLENLGELLEENQIWEDRDRNKATELLKNNNFFVFNVKPRYYHRLPKCFISNAIPNYKIKLTRSNLIDQLTSLCVQVLDTKTGFDPRYPKPDYAIDINLDAIRRCIYSYIDYENIHNQTSVKFDATVTYDEIKPLLAYSNITLAWKPLNYDELHEVVNKEYKLATSRLLKLNTWIDNLGTVDNV